MEFPNYIDYTNTETHIFDVRLFYTSVPSDGIFFEFTELAPLKTYLKNELEYVF